MEEQSILHTKKKSSYFTLIFIIFILLFLSFYLYYLYAINTPISNSNEVKEFVISPGQSSSLIGKNLKESGIISHALFFEIYSWMSGADDRLQAGKHSIPKNASLKEVVKLVSSVKRKLEKEFTLIEGLTNKEMAKYFEINDIMTRDEFVQVTSKKADWWDEFGFLSSRPTNVDLEGYLFPDTYRVYSDAKPEDIIKKILYNFDKKLTSELRKEILEQGKTIHEIITLASIIEKEVSTDEDRKIVAGIFYNRFKKGRPLQI